MNPQGDGACESQLPQQHQMLTVYTVGHSNHEPEAFRALLQQNGIEMVVDVRSSPYSRYVPQANRENLARALQAYGIAYRWLGESLGGKPDGTVGDYVAIRQSSTFRTGIDELRKLAAVRRTVIMCSEGDHHSCHRYKLITPVLHDQGVRVLHIQPDGSIVDEDAQPRQLELF